ncbi:aldo/keto reductase [uncultured Gulosibacter sp.]|uniref:aldo/keto reductase n=1 Tax=uncultured Gulosibacter sp. TaxID=1339167 RepID=UPI00288A8EEC|nr:aldo/keto reductase [uncultured Gulosibacter sp.]
MTNSLGIRLNDGRTIPQLGLGTYKMDPAATADLVAQAIDIGYRHIDTATLYNNETGVGEGLRRSGIDRDEVFITTKVWQDMQGYDATLRAFDESLERLGLDEVDLYLIHWPAPALDRYLETWDALERLHDEGRARSIGVANFKAHHLERLIQEADVVPAVNQVELHPAFQQPELRHFHLQHGIATEAWAPLRRGDALAKPLVQELAEKYGRTPAQIVLRWHIEIDNIAIPKSSHPERMRENLGAADFTLDADDIARLTQVDTGTRTGKDPDDFN